MATSEEMSTLASNLKFSYKREIDHLKRRLKDVLKEKTSITARWRRQDTNLSECKIKLFQANCLVKALQKDIRKPVIKTRTLWMNNGKIIRIIVALFDLNRTHNSIAKEHNMTRARVQQISAQAIDLGIDLPERKQGPKSKSLK